MAVDSEAPAGPATPQRMAEATPPGVWLPAAYFAMAGALELALSVRELPWPPAFWPAWEALGRGLLHVLLAAGLWHRIALCRSLAMVYCLATSIMYVAVLMLAFVKAPVSFPDSVVLKSLYEVPSCVLLFLHLRAPRASLLFPRPLIPR